MTPKHLTLVLQFLWMSPFQGLMILGVAYLHRASPCAIGFAPSELYMIKGVEYYF